MNEDDEPIILDEELILDEETQKAAAEFMTRLLAGVCPVCGAEVAQQVQFGRCVYAEPCGHRMYQGKAQKAKQ